MKSPRGKGELLNRLFSFDFGGNWQGLGPEVVIKRTKPHVATLFFPDIGRTFELVARIPRGEKPAKARTKGVAVGHAPPSPRRKQKAAASQATAH